MEEEIGVGLVSLEVARMGGFCVRTGEIAFSRVAFRETRRIGSAGAPYGHIEGWDLVSEFGIVFGDVWMFDHRFLLLLLSIV